MYFSYLFDYYLSNWQTISIRGSEWDSPRGHFQAYKGVQRLEGPGSIFHTEGDEAVIA